AMLSLGGRLKFKEKLSGRFADILSWMYLGLCALRRFEAEGRREEDLPLVRWALDWSLARIQEAFEGLYRNFEGPLAFWMRGPAAFWARLNPIGAAPSDREGGRLAAILQTPGEQRDRLTADLHLTTDPDEAVGRLERAFVLVGRSQADPDLAREAAEACLDAIQVDSFTLDEYLGLAETPDRVAATA
ncbi:MAG TPA: acyl-CoA dehydrogenase domain-containing protein, partial [Thermoanaerobaculia bacterium]|nr:acyl-CoA dehydrogenase domain-containing protein [Thermoanaerobaculia bacterium]